MDFAEIDKILEYMDKKGLAEFEYEKDGYRIKLRRKEANSIPVVMHQVPVNNTGAVPQTVEAKKENGNFHTVRAPLVGTFYRAPKPGAPPFAQAGDEVTSEKVLCIIEAMKVMNEIKAEIRGVIREVLVKDGEAVQYGDALFKIEKRG